MENKKLLRGICYILFSAFCFALMNLFVRLSGDLPSIQKSFFRNLIAFIVSFSILIKNKEKFDVHKGNIVDLICRSGFGLMGILGNFYAIDHLLLSDASMLNKMSPFFAVLFSFFLLKEKIGVKQIVLVCLAFVGSLFVIKPSFSNAAMFPAFIGLLGGMGAGAAYTFIRKLGQKGTSGTVIIAFFSAFSTLVNLPLFILYYQPMSARQLLFLLLAGLSATGGQFGITGAYCCAPAKEISVYDYSQIIFSAGLGFVVYHQIPDGFSVLGYSIIIMVAILMFLLSSGKKFGGKKQA